MPKSEHKENKKPVEEANKKILEEVEVVEPIEEEVKIENVALDKWNPKTEIGKKTKNGEITEIDFLLDKGIRVREPEIVDALIKDLKTDLLLIGQSKGKFGGGQRRVFRQTQKKTKEGNKPKFQTCAVIGNGDGYIGIGYGKSKETVPAREKAIRNSKLNLMKIRRGCGSWQCNCKEPHSIPFKAKGKSGSVIIELIPAPKGTGLRIEKECQKILGMAGVKDIWSKTLGQTETKVNVINALINALKMLQGVKVDSDKYKELAIVEGAIKK